MTDWTSTWSANLYNSVNRGNGALWNITDRIKRTWRRSTRAVGGYWNGTCEYAGTRDELLEMYLEGMAREIRATFSIAKNSQPGPGRRIVRCSRRLTTPA